MTRWVELYATTPSGKTQFVCRICGRKSVAPDRSCPEPPDVYQKMTLPCELIEEMEGALAEEAGTPSEQRGVRVLVIGDRTDTAPNGRRGHVIWSTQTERWRSTEVYFERKEDRDGKDGK